MSAPKTPEDVDRLFGEYMNAGDIEGLLSLYEPQGVFVQQHGEPLVGSAAIRTFFESVGDAKMSIRMNVTRVIRGGADIAVLYNDWTATLTVPTGDRTEMQGRAIEIVRRQADGSWRFVMDDPNARG